MNASPLHHHLQDKTPFASSNPKNNELITEEVRLYSDRFRTSRHPTRNSTRSQRTANGINRTKPYRWLLTGLWGLADFLNAGLRGTTEPSE
ncbi:hypothetical protein KC315_g23 [Hortaea werneckii]|nr:hypothetical protein KC315_g23 [Hortaea werneckii]